MQQVNDIIDVMIVEDHSIFLEGLQSVLSKIPFIEVKARFGDGGSALAFLSNDYADLVFLDVGLPGSSGIEICRSIKKISKTIKVIALSNHAEKHIISDMLTAGASGYLLKNASLPDLENAIRQVIAGHTAIPEDVKKLLFANTGHSGNRPRLTRREMEILKEVADGLTTAQIAEKLFISVQTVETHRYNLMKKFDVNNSVNLVRKAIEMGEYI